VVPLEFLTLQRKLGDYLVVLGSNDRVFSPSRLEGRDDDDSN